MTALMLLATLQQRGVELWIDAGRLRYRAPAGVLTADDKAVLAGMKEEVIHLLSLPTSTHESPPAASTHATEADDTPAVGNDCVPRTVEEEAPTHYWSAILQEDFWVCATAAQAAARRAKGQVAYLSEEIWHLHDLKARDPATFTAKLRAIHQAKKVFGGTLDALEQVAGADGAPTVQTVPDACHVCGTTRRWRSRYGAVICARCHPPGDAALVAR